MKLYIAGPMRGYDQFNFPAFDEAAARLRSFGYEIVNPAEIDRELGFDETTNDLSKFEELGGMAAAMHRDFGAILDCDGIALLPGWEHSSGARAELFVAQVTGRLVWLYGADDDGVWLTEYEGPTVVAALPEAAARSSEAALSAMVAEAEELGLYEEVRVVDPETGGAKGSKLARFDLLPWDALWAVAERFGAGAKKYEERNWERGYAWGLSHAAQHRHDAAFQMGEDLDPETGQPHLAAVAWHALVRLAFYLRGAGTDDRPRGLPDQAGTMADPHRRKA